MRLSYQGCSYEVVLPGENGMGRGSLSMPVGREMGGTCRWQELGGRSIQELGGRSIQELEAGVFRS